MYLGNVEITQSVTQSVSLTESPVFSHVGGAIILQSRSPHYATFAKPFRTNQSQFKYATVPLLSVSVPFTQKDEDSKHNPARGLLLSNHHSGTMVT